MSFIRLTLGVAIAALALSASPAFAQMLDDGRQGGDLDMPMNPVPEPSAALAFALGLGVIAARKRNGA